MTPLDKFLRDPRKPVWAILAVAFLARLAGVLVLFHQKTYFADEVMYLNLADYVASGHWLSRGALAPPGPVYFWAFWKMLGFSTTGLRIVDAAVGAGAVAVVFATGRRLFGARLAGVAALLTSFYPYLIYLSGIFYAQVVFQLTLALTFYGLLRFIQEERLRWLILGGFFLGLSALFVVPILSAAPILALWLLVAMRGPVVRRAAAVVILAAMSLGTIVPWTVRNYVVMKEFIFISNLGGRAFYWANNVYLDPYARDPDAWIDIYQKRIEREIARQGMNIPEMDRLLAFRAGRFLREHPGRAARNYLIRLSFFFDAAPRSFTTNVYTRNAKVTAVAILTSVPILLLAPIGFLFVVARRKLRICLPLALVPPAQALSFAMFHVSVRYRFPFEPYLILFAVFGFAALAWPGWREEPVAIADPVSPPKAS